MLSLLCRVRMPESLAGNDLNARAMQQGSTAAGGERRAGGGKGPRETMTPVWDCLLLSVPDTHESRDMRRLSLRSVALIGRERERRGEDLTGGKGGSELESALVLSLLCRVRMPESLAGNHLNARAIRQGRTGEGVREGALR